MIRQRTESSITKGGNMTDDTCSGSRQGVRGGAPWCSLGALVTPAGDEAL